MPLQIGIWRVFRDVQFAIWASLKTQQKLFILHPTDIRHPYKLGVVGESQRALASRIFEPRKKKYRTRGRMPAEFDSPRMGAK